MVKNNVFRGHTLGIAIGITVLTILFLASEVGAAPTEQWNRTFGGPNNQFGYSAQQTSDGGYIIAGQKFVQYPSGATGNDAWLIKTNANGTELWNHTYGGGNDLLNFAQQTSDGGYIAVGWTAAYGAGGVDARLIKTDANGKEEWNRTFGTANYDDAYFVQQTSDGGYALVGGTYSYGDGGYSAWLIKTNPNGTEQWNKTYRTNTRAQSIKQTPDGGYIIAGRTYPWGASYNSDAYLLKTDADGKEQWNSTYGTGGHEDAAYSIDQTIDGGYVFAGTTSSYGASANDAWLVKVNASGREQWNRTFGGTDYDYGYFVQRTLDNGYVVAGLTSAYSTSGNHGWLVKFNENGDKLWNMSFGGAKTDQIYSVQQTLDGGYILGGSTQSYAVGGTDAWLIKVSNDTNTSTPLSVLITIAVSPPGVTLNTSETQVFNATARDQSDKPMPGVNVSWIVSNSTVGSIDALYAMTNKNGNASITFTALVPGTTNVTATNGTISGWQAVTVTEPTETPTPTPTLAPTPTPIPTPAPTDQKPELPSNLNQFRSDGVTAIDVGNKTTDRTIVFKGTVEDLDGDKVRLQIELRRLDENGGKFDETLGGLKTSDLVSSGSEATISVSGLIDGNYHWRARAIDENGNYGEWQEFKGTDPLFSIKFIVSEYPHWVAVIPAKLGKDTTNSTPDDAFKDRASDLEKYYEQQSYGKEKLKTKFIPKHDSWNSAYGLDKTYDQYKNAYNSVNEARQEIISDILIQAEFEGTNLVPYDSIIVVFAADADTEDKFVAVSCNFNSKYPDINGGPSCKKSWSLIPENRMSNVWTHEVGHALFDFLDKYGCSDGGIECLGAAGGNIGYWGIMGMASQSGGGKIGLNNLSPVDPISKYNAGWMDKNWLTYGNNRPINLINDKGIYFFKPKAGDYNYAIEGRYPPDSAISDGWCNSNSCENVIDNPLKPKKGILLYQYYENAGVTAESVCYFIDKIVNIPNQNSKLKVSEADKNIVVDVAHDTVTLVPDVPSESTYDDYSTYTRFHVTQNSDQLNLDISKLSIYNKFVAVLGSIILHPLGLGSHGYVATQNIPDIDLKVYNSVGQMVGMNYTSGMYEIGIDGVNTSGNMYGGTEWIAYPSNLDLYYVIDTTPLKKWAEETNTTLPETITVEMHMIQYDSNGTRTETKPVNITVSTENLTAVQPSILLPPVITNVSISNVTASSAVIIWDTNKVADSLVKYSTSSGDYTLSETNITLTTKHLIKLENLKQNTQYYFVVNSTDIQENSNQSSEYSFKTKILYNYSGILPPIKPDGTSVFKLGSTIPVKFQLRDSVGNYVTDATGRIYLAKITNGIIGKEINGTSTGKTNKDNLFRYDSIGNQYIFNLGTQTLSTGTWQMRIELDDGTSKYIIIGLK